MSDTLEWFCKVNLDISSCFETPTDIFTRADLSNINNDTSQRGHSTAWETMGDPVKTKKSLDC